MTAAPVRMRGIPQDHFRDFGHLGGGGAFGAELTAAPTKIGINQMADATCTWRLMCSRMDVNGT